MAVTVFVATGDAVDAPGEAQVDDGGEIRPGSHFLAAEAIHFGEAAIVNDDPVLPVEHGDALLHVRQHRVEAQIGVRQLFRLRAETRLGIDGFPVQKEEDADEGRDRERDGEAAQTGNRCATAPEVENIRFGRRRHR